MKRVVLVVMVLLAVVLVWRWNAPVPALRDGDLVFQSSHSRQSTAILAATRSAYTHMGIIERHSDGLYVVEADGPVKTTPLGVWIARGRFGRYAVYRYRGLTSAQAAAVLRAAHVYDGRPYDLFFSFDNRAIYCSELPWLAFRAAGVPVGQVETLGALHVDSALTGRLIRARWRQDPACAGLSFDACVSVLRRRPMITPKAMARDPHLDRVYSNYPW